MREKYLWLAVIFLAVLTLGQACYIYEQRASAADDAPPSQERSELRRQANAEKASDAQWEEFEKWRETVRRQSAGGAPLPNPDFDAFFNDRFFAGRFDPFEEMQSVRARMSDTFTGGEKALFDGYWDKWFEQRIRMDQFKTDIARTDADVTLTIQVPGLAGNSADIDIKDGRIRISFSAKTSSTERNENGIIKGETSQSYIKVLPVPPDAETGTGKVEIAGEKVRIKFTRKKTGLR